MILIRPPRSGGRSGLSGSFRGCGQAGDLADRNRLVQTVRAARGGAQKNLTVIPARAGIQ